MTEHTKPGPASGGNVKRAALDFMSAKTAKMQPDARQSKTAGSGSAAQRPVPKFSDLPQYKQMKAHQAAGVALGIENPFYRAHEGAPGATTLINGASYTNFASYDYLSLNQDPRVRAAAIEAIGTYGISSSASRLVAGERPIHQQLEAKLAAFHGVEAAVAMVSGYLTNLTTITCLMGPTDLILHDELIHNSILAGAQASGATRRSFKHNDLVDLERMLLRLSSRHRRVLVIVEGLYSMDGDLADLPKLIELRRKHGFWLMVDEAHSVGILGATGRGSAEHFGVDPTEVDVWMGTLSKSTASCGGYIAGKAELIDILKGYAKRVCLQRRIAARDCGCRCKVCGSDRRGAEPRFATARQVAIFPATAQGRRSRDRILCRLCCGTGHGWGFDQGGDAVAGDDGCRHQRIADPVSRRA